MWMQGILYLVMMVINICRLKIQKKKKKEENFCVPLHCLCAVDYLKILFAIWIFLKEIRWLSSHRWDCRINQKLTLWSSQWLTLHIYLFIYSTPFIFIAFWPVTMSQLTQFTVCLLLWILLTGNMLLNVILSTSSQLYTHWYYTLLKNQIKALAESYCW